MWIKSVWLRVTPTYGTSAIAKRRLTCVDTVSTRRLTSFYTDFMHARSRDDQIIRLVGRFSQLRTDQLRRTIFASNRSDAVVKRVLLRLYQANMLHRIPYGQTYVYSLGINGYRWIKPRGGKYTPLRTVNRHSLAIGDAYVAIREAERAGRLEVKRYAIESRDINVDGIELRPDIDIDLIIDGKPAHWWLEADLGTEDTKQLRNKIENIIEAKRRSGVYQEADGSHTVIHPVPFPLVTFIVPDDERRAELDYILARIDQGERATFRVLLPAEFPESLLQ